MDDRASKQKGLAWLLAACGLGVLFAFGISPIAHTIPWSWEKRLAYTLHMNPAEHECRSSLKAQAILRKLVSRIYPLNPDDKSFSIEVRIIDDPIVNAYAGLGGAIAINSGLLEQAESAEEVAGILAHEIGHVRHRHIMEHAIVDMFTAEGIKMVFGGHTSAAEWTNYFLSMDFSRSQEAQADEDELKRLQAARVDNQGFRHFFERMEKSDSTPIFLSDHPSDQSRLEMLGKFENPHTVPIMTPDEWKTLKTCCQKN